MDSESETEQVSKHKVKSKSKHSLLSKKEKSKHLSEAVSPKENGRKGTMDVWFSDSDAEPSSSSRKKPSSSPKKSSKKPSAVDNILLGLSDDSDYEIWPKKTTKADSSEDKGLLAAKQASALEYEKQQRSRTRMLPIRSLKLLKGSSLMGPFVLHLILRRLPLTPTQIQTRTIALSELSRQERKRSLKSCSQAVRPTKRTRTSQSTNQLPQAEQTRGRRETTASVTATPSGPDSPDLCPMPHTKRAILANLGAGEEIAVMVAWT